MEREFININFDRSRFLMSCKLSYKNQLLQDQSIMGGAKVIIIIGIISLVILLFFKSTFLVYFGALGIIFFIGVMALIILGLFQTNCEFKEEYFRIINGFDLNMRLLYNEDYFELYSFNDVNNAYSENWKNVSDVFFVKKTNSIIVNLKGKKRIIVIPSIEEVGKIDSLIKFIKFLDIKVEELI